MKLQYLLIFAFAFSFFTCEEVPPTVTGVMVVDDEEPPEPPDDFDTQQKNVLIEEFTGVRCVQCPAGSVFLEELLVIHGKRLVAVSIHAGDFVPPYPESLYNFQTPEGDDILNFVGAPQGYPSAVVSRKKFDGEFDRQLGLAQWAGYIDQEKVDPPKIKLLVEPEYDEATRDLKITVPMLVEEDILEEARLSIMFTESGIVDLQKVPGMSDPDPNYVHKHALRGMATVSTGQVLTQSLVAGTFFEEEFDFTVPEEWVAENCTIVAFIHSGTDSKEIFQAIEVDMVQ